MCQRGLNALHLLLKPLTVSQQLLLWASMVGATKKERSAIIWLIVLPIALAIIGALTLPATRRRRRMMSQS